MLPSMTPAVTRALEAARRYAGGAAAVEPAHLLHGLLEEEDGRPATLAAEAGLDRPRYLAARGEPGPAPPGGLPLAPATEALLYRARELAAQRGGDRTVPSEAVLLALVRHDAGLAAWLA